MLYATRKYQELLSKKKKENGSAARLASGVSREIIEEAKTLYKVKKSTEIFPSMIRSRVKRNDARNGINLEENRRKRVETAKQAIAKKTKRYTAGLHVAAQRYMIGPMVLEYQEEREREQKATLSSRQEKKLQAFRAQKRKVDAIKALQKSPEEMSVSQLRAMVIWYKQAGDLPVPHSKALLIARLNASTGRQEPREPEIPSFVQDLLSAAKVKDAMIVHEHDEEVVEEE